MMVFERIEVKEVNVISSSEVNNRHFEVYNRVGASNSKITKMTSN